MANSKINMMPFMKLSKVNDIYVDYLITQHGQSTATGCAELIDNDVKHDSFTRMLSTRFRSFFQKIYLQFFASFVQAYLLFK